MIEPFKQKSLARLRRVRGQVEGIIKMIEQDKYCVDIVAQVLALEGGLKGVAHLILESHMRTCGEKELGSKDPKKREKFIKDIIKIVEFSGR